MGFKGLTREQERQRRINIIKVSIATARANDLEVDKEKLTTYTMDNFGVSEIKAEEYIKAAFRILDIDEVKAEEANTRALEEADEVLNAKTE